MLSPELGRAGFTIGIFVLMTSGGLLLALPPGTAEHVISLFMFVVGSLFTGALVALVRMGTRKQ